MRTSRDAALRIALACSAVAGLLYLVTSPCVVGWFDAPELAAAGQQLGVAHAPGEPAYVLLLRLVQLLPLGDLAARSAWLSCAAAAVLVGALVLLAREVLPDRCASPLGLGAVGLLAAFCGPLWTQGVVIELYGIQALLSVGVLLLVARADGRPGPIALAGFLAGLGFAVNPLLTVLAVPAALLLALVRPRPSLGAAGWAAAFAVLGASTYLYLPLRAATSPGVWYGGALDTPAEVLDFVSGRSYARSFERPGLATLAGNVLQHLWLVGGWLGWPTAAAALLGLVALARRPAVAVALVLFAVCAWATTATRPTLETFTPDVAGYLLPSCLVGSLLGGAGVAWLARRWTAPGLLLFALALGFTAAAGADKVAHHRGTAAPAVARALLETVPGGGLLLLGSDSTSLPVMYEVTAGRRRPDALAIGVYGTGGPQMRAWAERRPHIQLTPLATTDGLDPEERLRALVSPNLERGVVGTPLLWPPERIGELEPMGFGLAAAGAGDPRASERAAQVDAALIEPLWRQADLVRDRQLRRLLGTTAASAAHVLLRQGRTDAALARLRAASARHPDPWAMVHLQRASVEDGSLAPPVDLPVDSAGGIGRAALQQGDATLAAAFLEREIGVRAGDADLWEDMATALFWTRDPAAASAAWDRALALRPGSPGALLGKERLYAMGIP